MVISRGPWRAHDNKTRWLSNQHIKVLIVTPTPSREYQLTMNTMRTAFISDQRFLDHDTGAGHPERPARLSHTLKLLKAQNWFGQLQQLDAQACATQWLRSVHDSALLERAKDSCARGLPYLDTPDVAISTGSYDIALLAAGSVLVLADQIASGACDNGFALVRPPGHHAERDAALGFCLFNNIAIAARYLQRQHGLERILILDWDVHHGNGTQHLFEKDPNVFYISLHQYPHYPGTGARTENGSGSGRGATLNCPMPAGAGDAAYAQAFSEKVLPAIDHFQPDIILISAGFDAHQADPLGDIDLSTDHYHWMTERLLEMTAKHCDNRLLSVLEGGYHLDALAQSVATHLEALAGIPVRP